MHFVVHCLDHADAGATRLAHYEAHRAYLKSPPVKMIISGPLVAEDHATMIGSFFLIEADSVDEVAAFSQADPFSVAGVWKTVQIHAFLKRVDNR
jgi:uncharacterized protein YciI